MPANSTRLVSRRDPSRKEEARGADIIFERRTASGRSYTIFASYCAKYSSWMQWNAPNEVLGDNVDAIDAWADERARAFLGEEA